MSVFFIIFDYPNISTMKTLLLSLLFCLALLTSSQGQYIRCGADEHQAVLDAAHPELAAQRQAFDSRIASMVENNTQAKTSLIVYIPVVFHVIYANAAQNIPDAKIYEQLDVLNKDYSRTNVDATNTRSQFLSVAANTQIQFCLAQQTPAGAPTTGIVRVSSPTFPSNPHTLSPEWNHLKYLNIYIGNLGSGLLGYSNLPPGSTGNDHAVILYSAVGGPNNPGTATPYHLGRTATHEIGHWLNLNHTFNNGCGGTTANNCTTGGDRVCDTPPVSSSTFNCPASNPNTCTEINPFPPPYTMDMVDMFENYMDYTDDGCMNVFTEGQSTRMNDAITQLRSGLLTSQGCVPVGIEEILDPSYVMVSPNPSDGIFNVNFNFPAATKVNLQISDLAGRLVYNSQFDVSVTGSTEIDLTKLSTGAYQLMAATDKGYLVKRIVIAR